MTTATTTTRVRHDSDAAFREWGLEFQTQLLAIGLAADETNINWATITRAGIGAEAGYEVYHLNDSLHGTAPIYIRVGYGTHTGATDRPRIQITIGTSTNGSGVLGGTALTAADAVGAAAQATSDTTRVSRWCASEGFFGFSWKEGFAGHGFFAVVRGCDTEGVPTAKGAQVVWGSSSASTLNGTQALRFQATAKAFTKTTTVPSMALSINPQMRAASGLGGDHDAFNTWTALPEATNLIGLCGLIVGDALATGTTFALALVGDDLHTYVALPTTAGPVGGTGGGGANTLKYAMLWE